MPIVSCDDNPSLHRVAIEGLEIISAEQAKHQDIRELHIGFLNMMPDTAFLSTERQFFRLTAASTNIVQIYIHPIDCKGLSHNAEITRHIKKYYKDFDKLKKDGLDAIIVTGANPKFKDLTQEPYWQHAKSVFDWASQNVCSVFFSCLASHVVLQAQYNLQRIPLAKKLWGIYSHSVIDTKHPLVSNINTRFDMPHSRCHEVRKDMLVQKELNILAIGEISGVALATSKDGFRKVFCQGHLEYDTASILKEYKREVFRFINKERSDYPLSPHGYGNVEVKEILSMFKEQLLAGKIDIEEFPEKDILRYLDNTWRDTAKAIFSNWLALIYRVTHLDRRIPFMDSIDPNFPISKLYK